MIRPALLAISLALFVASAHGQDLPSKIRGYKVYKVKIHVAARGDEAPGDAGASVMLGEPRIVEAAIGGIVFETTAELQGLSQSGEIDMITFKDIVVNGTPVDTEDYVHPFSIRKGMAVKLPVPVRGSVNSLSIAKAGFTGCGSPRAEWRVTGTVFVFGRFKKFGMTFKRVIPVPVDLSIKNPMPALLGQ